MHKKREYQAAGNHCSIWSQKSCIRSWACIRRSRVCTTYKWLTRIFAGFAIWAAAGVFIVALGTTLFLKSCQFYSTWSDKKNVW